MKTLFVTLLTVLSFITITASAAPVKRLAQPVKIPSQEVLEHQTIVTPILADDDRVLTTNAGPTSAAVVAVTSFTAQPDVARNITITPTGTTTDVEACNVTVSGTNIFGKPISEVLAFLANASTATAGLKAFKTVTSVSWAANCESGGFAATWTIGVGDVLGLNRCMANAGSLGWTAFNGAFETTRATTVADSNEVEKNTIDVNGTLDGAKSVEAFYVQNFGCFP